MLLQCVKRIQNLWKERLTSAFTLRERVQNLWKERLTCAFTMSEKDTKLVEGEADKCLYSA